MGLLAAASAGEGAGAKEPNTAAYRPTGCSLSLWPSTFAFAFSICSLHFRFRFFSPASSPPCCFLCTITIEFELVRYARRDSGVVWLFPSLGNGGRYERARTPR
jgi:hypothetical protein